MDFFRYIFLVSILAGCTSAGFILSNGYTNRVKELKCLENLIKILQNKIKFTHKPLQEILEEISTLRLNTIIPKIFYKTSQKLQSQNCEQALNEAIEEERFFLNLKSEDIELLKTLGLLLGKTDIDGQMSELNQFSTLLNAQIKKAEQEENKNKKMYKSLGTIIGLAIVIILL